MLFKKKNPTVGQLNKYIFKCEVTYSLLHYIWAIRYDLDASHWSVMRLFSYLRVKQAIPVAA